MKKIFSFCFVLFITGVYAQKDMPTTLQITYKALPLQNADIPESPEASRIVKQINHFMQYIEFELLANDTQSLFKMKKLLANENASKYIVKLAVTTSYGYETWYTADKAKTRFLVTNSEEVPTRLNEVPENKWELHKETKTIGGLLCHKATSVRQEGQRTVPITAWFAPELPYGYGPIGFNGLPGTILELQVPETVLYKATIIKRNSNKKINPPKYKAETTHAAYYKKLDEEVGAIMARGY